MPLPVLRRRLTELVDAFAGRKVAVVGDFVLDRFLHGRPKRISREAPVLILRYASLESVPGGGANTAANAAALGASVFPAGVIGADEEGRELASLLRERGVDASGLLPVDSYPTPTKTRVLAGGVHSIKQQIVRIDREEPLAESGAWLSKLRESIGRAASFADVLVLADYGYGSSRPEWVAEARAANPSVKILVDSRFRLAEYSGCDAATPNEEELEQSFSAPLGESGEKFESAGRALSARLGDAALLVTRGSSGMSLMEPGRATVHIPVHGTDQVADVTGAGDTVMAAFALGLAAGASFLEAALLSNFAGGVVVMKMGTATVSSEQLKAAIASDRTILA